MKAMILAAGLGTRLLPMTRETAKPAIPFANRPLIHYCLEWLVGNGVDEVVINLHHHPESVVSGIGERGWPLKIHFSHEPNLLGTAGGLKKAERYFKDGTFVMVNSDSLFEIDLVTPMAHHREKGGIATMVLCEKSSEGSYGTVKIDEEGRIITIKGRGLPQAEGRGCFFIGIHLFEPEVFDWIPPGCFYEINQTVYPLLIQEGQGVWGFVTDTFWAEVGSPRTYLHAHRDFLTRRGFGVTSESGLSDRVERIPPVLIGRNCLVGDGVRVGPSVVVGQSCHIGEGAVIEDSVIWDGVAIGVGAHIRGSILGHGTIVDPGTQVEGMVVCGGERKSID